MNKNYVTSEAYKALKEELEELKTKKRKEIAEIIQDAKELGDLSENAEYHQAREDQGKLEERIHKVESILQSFQVVKGGGGDTVEIGSKVSVVKENEKEERIYEIVGSEEADMSKGKVSNRSPFGEALFGKKSGDKIIFKTPGGTANYKIVKVS